MIMFLSSRTEHLKILPTDTEEQRNKKKKKIKSLKHTTKKKELEELRNTKQASWQSFVKKAGSKRVKGSMSRKVVGRDSMFASPDAVDGKVGVTGSGQGTTDFEQRKRQEKLRFLKKQSV